MPSSKREREYERRRYEKWQERRQAKEVNRRRTRVIAGALCGVLVIAVGVAAAVALSGSDNTADAAATPTATTTDAATDTSSASASSVILGEARTANGGEVPDPSLAEDRTWTGTITTNQGDIGVELDGSLAPQAVANFVVLAQEDYFVQTSCHRLTTSGLYVLQCGDPTGTGSGSPGYNFGPVENAPADGVYPAGTIAMARASAEDSMGSQFFIVYEDTTLTDDVGYTVFGQVTSGLDVIMAIADGGVENGGTDGAPAMPVTIEEVVVQ